MPEEEVLPQAGYGAARLAIPSPRKWSSVLTRIEQKWTEVQVERQGAYSVEHLMSLNSYCKTTSITRVVLVCALSPLPALLTALMVECLPLRSPSEGWRANWTFWIRVLLVQLILGFGGNFMLARFVPGLHFTFLKNLVKTTCGCSLFMGTCILAASQIGFPVPLMMQLGTIPIGFYDLLTARLVLGSVLFAKDSPLKPYANRFNRLFSSLMAFAAVFPIYKTLYLFLPVEYRAITIVILPIWKFAAKQFMVNATRELEDFIPMGVAFAVDFFSTLFVSACVSTSKSISLKLLLVAADIGESLLQFRSMKANGMELLVLLDERKNSIHQHHHQVISLERADLPSILLDAIHSSATFPPKSLENIRLWACVPYPLSGELGQLHALDAVKVYAHHVAPLRRNVLHAGSPHPDRRLLHATSVAPTPVTNTSQLISTERKHASLCHIERSSKLVIQGLQLLFHSEYVILVQYIECVVPLVYLVFKWTLENLPNVAFYPGGAGNWDSTTTVNVLIFAVLEIGLLFTFDKFVERKFSLSLLRQLAYVLESEVYVVQPIFFCMFLNLLQFELDHFGADFTLRFQWLES